MNLFLVLVYKYKTRKMNMQRIILFFIGITLTQILWAQQAEKIPSYAKEKREMRWYKEQIKAWDQVIQKNQKDENAWYNYYKANRIVIFNDEENQPSVREKDQRLIDIVDRMGKQIPETYTYNFCKWQLGGNNMEYYPFLKKAIAIAPERTEHYDYMINIGELERDMALRNEYCLKVQQSGQLSSGMMYYNYNTMIGLSQNAILLTSGDNDTYPSWVLQAMGIRKDVKVINLYLLHIESYRDKVFKELGIQHVELTKETEFDFFNHKLVQHMSKNKLNATVYLALTSAGNHAFINEIENQLYLTGLVYQYDTNAVDNMAMLKLNFEKKYALDYLDKPFYNEISKDWVSMINQNYIVPMVKLYEHYKMSGELQKQQWIKEKLLLVSKGSAEEDKIHDLLN